MAKEVMEKIKNKCPNGKEILERGMKYNQMH
jgi:hypothetical protein